MSRICDRDYYASRAANAREMEKRAISPSVAAIHAELARRYDFMASLSLEKAEAIMTVSQTV